jgi:coenzyme F420 biosynthesis associated uncharacterized protein
MAARTAGAPAPDVIAWDLAVRTAARWHPRGPVVDPGWARAAVHSLYESAAAAVDPVRGVTGLVADFDPGRVSVVDRARWSAANIRGIQYTFGGALREVRDRSRRTRAVEALGSRATATQLGGVLAWLSGKVLGQFDVFDPVGERLLLVAPSIVAAESALDVPPGDFRLWVCLHEEAHRVQFTAVPWLGDYLISGVRSFILADDELSLADRIRALSSGSASGIAEVMASPEQRRILDRMAATMSVLEGHAEVVMDAVGPEVISTVDLLRERFDQRRAHPGRLDGVLRALLGLNSKLRQYTEGAAFVRGVVATVGMEGFNRVWQGPDCLPTADEVTDPRAWVRRVCE